MSVIASRVKLMSRNLRGMDKKVKYVGTDLEWEHCSKSTIRKLLHGLDLANELL